jgi:acetyl-CoA C-acetyltransferase
MTGEAYMYEANRTPARPRQDRAPDATKPVDLVIGLIGELRQRLLGLEPSYLDDVVLGVVTPVGDHGCRCSRTEGRCSMSRPRPTTTARRSRPVHAV